MTGYWTAPNALVLPYDDLEFALSRRDAPFGARLNWIAAAGLLPHLELVGRYAMPYASAGGDLSFNPKLGYTFFEGSVHPSSLAVGAQDLLGGARHMHAKYLVATQRWRWFEGSIGYGIPWRNSSGTRLDGLFWGLEGDVPGLEASPIRASAVVDDDGRDLRVGGRLGLRGDGWRAHAGLARDLTNPKWEWMVGAGVALPPARAGKALDSSCLVRLRAGPWVQSFLGTEVGRLDAQVALEVTGIVQPVPEALAWARVRDRIWYSRNFGDGKAFQYFRQEPVLWLEGAGAGWSPSNRLDKGVWVQGGVADGSWSGGALEASWEPWGHRLRLGGMGGYWYSPEWQGDREVAMTWVDWESSDRAWWTRADAGRYWNRDDGFRTRLGRRYGRLVPSVGLAWTDRTWQLDARMEIELDGLGWRAGKALALEPVPVWGHGYATTLNFRQGEGNPLRPGLGREPPLPLRGRYQTWP